MDNDAPARAQVIDQPVYELRHCLARAGKTPIGDRKRLELEAACRGKVRLLDKRELGFFLWL
jgi:hypothetical protein